MFNFQHSQFTQQEMEDLAELLLKYPINFMRECLAIIYTLTKYEYLVFGSKHPIVLFTDHKIKFSYLHKNQILTTEFGDFNYF